MTTTDYRRQLLRASRSPEDSRVGFVELFFDLVFVFAITQLAHSLLHHLSAIGFLEMVLLLLAVWWVWIYTTWVTNWLDPQTTLVRIMLFAMMFGGIIFAVSIPDAFGSSGLTFALAYVGMQVGRTAFMCWVLRGIDAVNHRNFLRILIWKIIAALFWILGALEPSHDTRLVLWGGALAIEYLAPAIYFWTPGLGRSTTADWDISGEHMAERCGLFIIIALGESLLVTGHSLSELALSPMTLFAFTTAFFSTVAMWWVYFNIGAERASHLIASHEDPGHVARVAYTYSHILIVAGIVMVAVSDEFVLTHPMGFAQQPLLSSALLLGGPFLFLAGNLAFKRMAFGAFALSHVVGMLIMVSCLFAFQLLIPLVQAMIASATLILVGVWEHTSVVAKR